MTYKGRSTSIKVSLRFPFFLPKPPHYNQSLQHYRFKMTLTFSNNGVSTFHQVERKENTYVIYNVSSDYTSMAVETATL